VVGNVTYLVSFFGNEKGFSYIEKKKLQVTITVGDNTASEVSYTALIQRSQS
jgi:hypothetical protein